MSEPGFAVADVSGIEAETPPQDIAVGYSPRRLCEVRPDLNGRRLKYPEFNTIYLVEHGLGRAIPNSRTYNDLFRDWKGIIEDGTWICQGNPLPDGAILATATEIRTVYLIDVGVKRAIANSETMDRYHFNWGRIYVVPRILLQNIPDGPTIMWPEKS